MTPREQAEEVVKNWGGPELLDWERRSLVNRITTAIQAASNEQLERCRTHDRQGDVSAFHRKFGVPHPERPGWPSQERIELRVKLIAEEFCEFLEACGCGFDLAIWNGWSGKDIVQNSSETEFKPSADLPKAADALIDMEYVILGTHNEFGIDSNPLWAEVQASNCSKTGGAVREDGKILKGPDFKPPQIERLLREQGWHDGQA